MEELLEVSLWNILGWFAGLILVASIVVIIVSIFRGNLVQEIHPDEEHKYFPPKKVDNKKR